MQNGFDQTEKVLQLRINFNGNLLQTTEIASSYNLKKTRNFQLKVILVTKIAF